MMLKISVNTDGLAAVKDTVVTKAIKAENVLANQVMKDTRPYVPMLTGSLDTRTRVEENLVIYPGPYARFLYYGKLMVDPNTGSPFAPAGVTKVVTDRDLVFTKDFHPDAQSHWFEASKAENMDKWERISQRTVNE